MIATTHSSKDDKTLWISVPVSKVLLDDDEMKRWAEERVGEMASAALRDYLEQGSEAKAA